MTAEERAAQVQRNIERMRKKRLAAKSGKSPNKPGNTNSDDDDVVTPTSKGKAKRRWDDKLSAEEMAALDKVKHYQYYLFVVVVFFLKMRANSIVDTDESGR